MRILGIDPGYAILGWGVLDYTGNRFKTVAYDSLLTDAGVPMPDRLRSLYLGLEDIIRRYQPDECSIEELFSTETSLLPSALERPEALQCSPVPTTTYLFSNTLLWKSRLLSQAMARLRKNRCR